MVACCARKTYAGTTIADVVSEAAVSRSTFYKLFGDKRDCFDAAVTHSIDRIAETVAAAAAGHDSPAEATRQGASAMLELLAAEPELALLLSGDVLGVDPSLVERYSAFTVPALEGMWEREGMPPPKHLSPGLAFGRAQLLVFREAIAGRPERLPGLLPDVVYLAIVPFAGHDEALREARLAGVEVAR
jgi:AcrR family transcriptional regulator